MANIETLIKTATQIRRDIVRMVNMAGSGHPGGSLSSTDVVTALYFSVMKHDPATWTRDCKGQDVFIPSAGHLAPVYYAALARAGYFPLSELGTLRKFGSRLQGHPSVSHGLPGVVQASGSLGQGLACAAGIALGKKLDGDNTRVYCLLGDGEQEEGEVWESAIFAAHHGIDNLVAITDWNCKQIDGDINEVAGMGDLQAKWAAFGWETIVVEDGNDMESILKAFDKAVTVKGKPVMILLHTEMGHGIDFMAGKHGWHGKAPKAEEVALALEQLEETLGDF
ncbi:MAG: transketolase [Bacteroidales bacterium]|nr:transketolase [Candidatus Cacconaster scatequi]